MIVFGSFYSALNPAIKGYLLLNFSSFRFFSYSNLAYSLVTSLALYYWFSRRVFSSLSNTQLFLRGFLFKLMGFLFKLMGFLFKLMGFLFKLMGFLFKLMGFQNSQFKWTFFPGNIFLFWPALISFLGHVNCHTTCWARSVQPFWWSNSQI